MNKMAIETDFAKEFENFRKRLLELEEKGRKDESRRLMLEVEVESLKKKNDELEEKIATIQKVVADSTSLANDNEILFEVMAENKALEAEKTKAETELCLMKEKVKEWELNLRGMSEKVKDGQLVTRCSLCPKKMAPSTPGVVRSAVRGVSDDNVNYNKFPTVEEASRSRKCGYFAKSQCFSKIDLQKTNLQHVDGEQTDDFNFHSSSTRSVKRKRAANIVDSDDESNYDDNAPICTLKTQHSSRVMPNSEEEVKENAGRSYLTRLRKLASKNEIDKSSIDLNKYFSSSEDEEYDDGVDESDGEGKSLGGFIVDSSDSVSERSSDSSDSIDKSEDVLKSEDGLYEYKATMEKVSRNKSSHLKWDLEGDMLSDFGKDATLCMRALCALYRQQSDDEQSSKVTIHQNERGFSKPDAFRASELAEFLMDGDPNGDLKKTVEELKAYDSKGDKLCMQLANKYSKQLFEIYQNKEDPYFMPQ